MRKCVYVCVFVHSECVCVCLFVCFVTLCLRGELWGRGEGGGKGCFGSQVRTASRKTKVKKFKNQMLQTCWRNICAGPRVCVCVCQQLRFKPAAVVRGERQTYLKRGRGCWGSCKEPEHTSTYLCILTHTNIVYSLYKAQHVDFTRVPSARVCFPKLLWASLCMCVFAFLGMRVCEFVCVCVCGRMRVQGCSL